MNTDWPEQLFILSDDILAGMNRVDVLAICHDLKEMGLYADPFNHYAVQYNGTIDARFHSPRPNKSTVSEEDQKRDVERVFFKGGNCYRFDFDIGDGLGFMDMTPEFLLSEHEWSRDVLIAVLATKGVARTVKESKLAKMGIGNKSRPRFHYTTTLSISTSLGERGDSTGRSVRPHLRRGHIKRVRYGPKYAFVRKVWIEPCFVMGDDPAELTRDHYNVA